MRGPRSALSRSLSPSVAAAVRCSRAAAMLDSFNAMVPSSKCALPSTHLRPLAATAPFRSSRASAVRPRAARADPWRYSHNASSPTSARAGVARRHRHPFVENAFRVSGATGSHEC